MKLKYTIYIILFTNCVFSQTQIWNNWYFGENAGISFNTEPPTVLTDGKLNTNEGCASISDNNGSLIFYTNGVNVWDRNHNVMPNGNDLQGSLSAKQSVIILQKPQSEHIYYVFTTSASENDSHSLRYSVVDIRLNNGFGDIISSKKNILVHSDSSEGLTATLHSNGVDFWIISHSHSKNKFYCNLFSASGISKSSIESALNNNYKIHHTALKISVFAKFIAMINQDDKIILCKFDNNSGVVKLQNLFKFSDISLPYNLFGIEFSKDETKLYAVLNKIALSSSEMRVFQFDLSEKSAFNPTIITQTNGTLAYDMQIATNNKIYISFSGKNYLSAINNPNGKGTKCNFELSSINLQSGKCKLGLPNCIFVSNKLTFVSNDVCLGNNSTFTINNTTNIKSLQWNFGDGTSSTEQNPTHSYTTAGTYTVELTVTYINGTTQTAIKNITISEKPKKPVILHD